MAVPGVGRIVAIGSISTSAMSSAGHIYFNIMNMWTIATLEGHWFVEIYREQNCICVWRNILLFLSVEDLLMVTDIHWNIDHWSSQNGQAHTSDGDTIDIVY